MPTIAALTSFTANTQAKAAEVNANFSTIRTTVNTYAAFIDQPATITGVWTFNATPVLTTGLTVSAGGVTVTAGGVTVSAGGLTVTGNSTITGTLGGLTGLTVTGTATATTFSGSGASLTSIPQSGVTNLVSDLSGKAATSHTHDGSAITAGTVSSARLPSSYTALTITTLTGTTAIVPTLQSAASSPRMIMNVSESASYLVEATSAAPCMTLAGGTGTLNGTALGTLPGPTGTTGDPSTIRYFRVRIAGNDWYMPAFGF
jgi:hypothetical protein